MRERRRLLVFGLIFFGLLAVAAYYNLVLTVSADTDLPPQLYKIDRLF